MKKIFHRWAALALMCSLSVTFIPTKGAKADMFGGDIAVLLQILVQSIDQVYKLQQMIGKATETVHLLEEMNRGVKEVLRIADTAHVPIPAGVFEQAKRIDQAVWAAKRVYGDVSAKAPTHTRTNYRSGVEALNLSQDAFDYSTYLDKTGDQVKSSAITANQVAATRLTAETLGVLLHSTSHSNRLQAKELEISSSQRIEESAKDSARFESYQNTHQRIEDEMKNSSFSSLNGIGY